MTSSFQTIRLILSCARLLVRFCQPPRLGFYLQKTEMVFYRERENGTRERPPLSLILPHLYLGAETDVTQECLVPRGISYVLSVSRCSPQPSFLPGSRYLRIPIDDSLRDDLLSHIPEALRFIDGAMSSGGSVLVHCAAGISRSPAVAVAYIMYSLQMDLDHAYEFVKERRPSISPNFNFLGQLQQFQSTLPQKASSGPIKIQDACLQLTNENILRCSSVPPLSANRSLNIPDNICVAKDFLEVANVPILDNEISICNTGKAEQRYSGETQSLSDRPQPELRLSLSSQLKMLTLNLNQNHHQRAPDSLCSAKYPNYNEQPTPKPTTLQIPSGLVSLSEKRRSLTLSLTPVNAVPLTPHQGELEKGYINGHQSIQSSDSNIVHKRESGCNVGSKTCSRKPVIIGGLSSTQTDVKQQETITSGVKTAVRLNHRSSRTHARGEKQGQRHGKRESSRRQITEKGRLNSTPKAGKDHSKEKACRDTLRGSLSSRSDMRWRGPVVDLQVAPAAKLSVSAGEAEEAMDAEQGLLSPINLTVNKLLGWGERMLLGMLLSPRIKVGQPAVSYRC
ncbi:hypothetical protein DPEC_G00310070 [Dallia pectoralis]|uniref:Uncharacterized protein n=1 Tax=Dallia pectoralis TaxID=75939 RepID=A0ACC2FF07_DALPE|nr:hypothetical protein DPEC_G00310070 [Dallia pectoralis]